MANYLKQDREQGYVTDNAEINYLIFNNMRHTVFGCMLGDFDSHGIYSVDKEIVRELIEMKKYIVDSEDNIELCVSELKLLKQISFLVTFEGNRATLSLIEKINHEANIKINSGTYSDVNEFILDVIETSGEVDRNVVYHKWNISPFSGDILDVFKMDEETLSAYYGIVNRFKFLLSANNVLLKSDENIDSVESELAVRMLEIIKHYPKLKAVFDKQFKARLEEKSDFIKLDKPNFASTINEVVNNIVESNIGVLTEQDQEEFSLEKHNALVDYNIKIRDAVELKTNNPVLAHSEDILNENEKITDEIIGVENSNNQPSEVLIIDTKGTENRDINDISKEYAETLKQEQSKAIERALKDVFGDNSEASKDNNNEAIEGENNEVTQGKNYFHRVLIEATKEIIGTALIREIITSATEESIKEREQDRELETNNSSNKETKVEASATNGNTTRNVNSSSNTRNASNARVNARRSSNRSETNSRTKATTTQTNSSESTDSSDSYDYDDDDNRYGTQPTGRSLIRSVTEGLQDENKVDQSNTKVREPKDGETVKDESMLKVDRGSEDYEKIADIVKSKQNNMVNGCNSIMKDIIRTITDLEIKSNTNIENHEQEIVQN